MILERKFLELFSNFTPDFSSRHLLINKKELQFKMDHNPAEISTGIFRT
jgi:hypothetical protein